MTEYRIKVVPDEFNFGECPLGWSGDVYGVILERLTRWTSEFGDVDERWDTIPDCAIWGCYLNSDYTALDVARDYFGVELPDDVEVIYP